MGKRKNDNETGQISFFDDVAEIAEVKTDNVKLDTAEIEGEKKVKRKEKPQKTEKTNKKGKPEKLSGDESSEKPKRVKREKIDNLIFEREFLAQGVKYICGVDEVGRGPLAGPVTVAAVIMPLGENDIIEGIDDSKKLSEKKREMLFEQINEKAIAIKICSMDNLEIDRINILNATKECMKSAISNLAIKPDVVLIDAVELDIPYETKSIIKGDERSYSIAAASIIAKVTRDRMMRDYDEIYPGYGFASNKGYGSAVHIRAIKDLGATPVHRMSFIKNIIYEGNLEKLDGGYAGGNPFKKPAAKTEAAADWFDDDEVLDFKNKKSLPAKNKKG